MTAVQNKRSSCDAYPDMQASSEEDYEAEIQEVEAEMRKELQKDIVDDEDDYEEQSEMTPTNR